MLELTQDAKIVLATVVLENMTGGGGALIYRTSDYTLNDRAKTALDELTGLGLVGIVATREIEQGSDTVTMCYHTTALGLETMYDSNGQVDPELAALMDAIDRDPSTGFTILQPL